MKFKFIFNIFIFLFLATSLLAQNEEKPSDIIYMKNGSVFKGIVLSYTEGDVLTLELPNGGIVILKAKNIRKIIQSGIDTDKVVKAKKPYQFRETGWYNASYFSVQVAGSAFNDSETNTGIGVETIFGYQFDRLLGLGAGIGMDYYYIGSGSNFMPVFGEVRGYLFQKNFTPMYSIKAGYGFTFDDEDRNITDAKGGLMFHPAIGFRMGGSKLMNFTMDAGVKFQKGKFTYTNWETLEHQMTYKRLVIRLGIIF